LRLFQTNAFFISVIQRIITADLIKFKAKSQLIKQIYGWLYAWHMLFSPKIQSRHAYAYKIKKKKQILLVLLACYT